MPVAYYEPDASKSWSASFTAFKLLRLLVVHPREMNGIHLTFFEGNCDIVATI